MQDDPVAIARRLSPAMRESLCRRPCPSWWSGPPACLPWSLPTAAALTRRRLIDLRRGAITRACLLTPLGLRVRAVLAQEASDATA